MILATIEAIPDHRVVQVLGLVRGASIRARHLGQDIVATMRNITGGELFEYTKVLAEAREEAVDRMVDEARALGANAVLGVRFQSAEVTRGAAEMLCYGTAVRVERATP
ncbi:MAG: YbjQ family protein [Gemmatimonadota bacterium]|nr:YbjQ family protein [Gemmatimonadota bacterium]